MNGDTLQSTDPSTDAEGSSAEGPPEEDSSSEEDHTDRSTNVAVTTETVAELHRRLLAADSAVTDAETHLTVVSELATERKGAGTDVRTSTVCAELRATVDKLEETTRRVEEALTGARELSEAAEESRSDDDTERDRPDREAHTSVFDDEGYVRNSAGARPDDQEPT